VFERFTERARQVVVLAQDEARALKHDYIGTEHLLLGILREEHGAGGRVLEALGVRAVEARSQVVRIVGEGDEVRTGQIPFTAHAKRVLELALREALSLGHNSIGTEHVLLGIVRGSEGVATQLLQGFGLDADRIRNEVIRMLAGAPPPASEEILADQWPPPWTGFARTSNVSHGRLEPVVQPQPMLLRGILIGWALAAGTLGAGLLVGWLIWG
jgi:ATP-dependent Clp protease ATP-binding subunit ClpA